MNALIWGAPMENESYGAQEITGSLEMSSLMYGFASIEELI